MQSRHGSREIAGSRAGEKPLPREFPVTKQRTPEGGNHLKRKPLLPHSQLRDGSVLQENGGPRKQLREGQGFSMQRDEAGPLRSSSRVSDLLVQRRDPGASNGGGDNPRGSGRPAGLDLTRLPGTDLGLPSARNWTGPPTSRSVSATTFADVANVERGEGNEHAAMDLDNLEILNRAQGPAAGTAPTARGEEKAEVDVLPCDWSLKRRVIFISHQPFALQYGISRGQVLSTHDSGYAMQNRAAGRELGKFDSAELQLLQGLTTWQHPEMELPAVAVEAMRGDRGGQAFLAQRQTAWQEAFSSLFHMLRNGQVPCFYCIVNPTSGSREARFAVLFRAEVGARAGAGAGVGGGPSFVALVNRSTRGLRTVLRREGVHFSMPLAGTWEAAAEGQDLEELEEYKRAGGATKNVDGEAKVDGKPESLLVMNDPRDVMGLCEFLLNYRVGGSSDVPSLLSPTAFRNGALHTHRVTYTSATAAEGADGGGGGFERGAGRQRYRAVVNGVIPPWVAWRASRAMYTAQQGELEVQFLTDPDSSRLNLPGTEGAAEGGGATEGSGGGGVVAPLGGEGSEGGWLEAGLAVDGVLTGLMGLPAPPDCARFVARVMRNLPT